MAHEEDANEALLWMRHKAAERQCAICGSLAVHLRDGSYRNRHYFIDGRNGHEVFYDKHHLFTYGGENRYYTPGQSHTIVEYEGFRILLLTCYDLRFPCWSRYSDGQEYDLDRRCGELASVQTVRMADTDSRQSHRESGLPCGCQPGR